MSNIIKGYVFMAATWWFGILGVAYHSMFLLCLAIPLGFAGVVYFVRDLRDVLRRKR